MKLLSKDKHYIVGVSGGPDSMALFHMLLKDNISFSVAFVNYHKRKESVLEEESVRAYCNKYNIDFNLLCPKMDKKGNFQAWARNVRYDFFCKLSIEKNAEGIIVAHHKDDLLETYILQKNRGGIYSFYGIKPVSTFNNVKIFRPLLNYRKKELEQYCLDNNVPYYIDSSNLSNDYERNRVRHSIIEKLNNKDVDNLIKEIELKNIEQDKYKEEANIYLSTNKDKYDIIQFKKISKCAQKVVVYELFLNLNIIINGPEIDEIIKFINSSNQNKFMMVSELVLYKNYGYFEISNNEQFDYEYVVDKPSILDKELFFFDLIEGEDNFFIKKDSYPLTICHPNKKELVKIGQIYKKVNHLYIDEKISLKHRNYWPCIKDKNGKIIYFPRKMEDSNNGKLIFKIKK